MACSISIWITQAVGGVKKVTLPFTGNPSDLKDTFKETVHLYLIRNLLHGICFIHEPLYVYQL